MMLLLMLLLMLLNMLRDSSRGQLLRVGTFEHKRNENTSVQSHRNMRRTAPMLLKKERTAAPSALAFANFSKNFKKVRPS